MRSSLLSSTFVRRVGAGLAAIVTLGGLTAAPATAAEPRTYGMTSSFVAYEGTSYSGRSQDINGCGFHGIPFHGSYRWIPRGQDGRMHNAADGRDAVHTVLRSNRGAEQSTPFGWRSMYIVC
ncbi:MiAMP1 family antimicrobial peptide [Streptomyces sp. NPDC056149]|uniref:MiAMP1 family antimicrobial peptide n=1 Tax=Streptomyces sp. NPDC056149 TaxID=3345728 RepID=UPI0035E0A9C9